MSDLQCPAAVVLAVAGSEEDAQTLADALRDRRVSVVYAQAGAAPTATARGVARRLGAPLRDLPDSLAEDEPASGGADDVAVTAGRLRACLDALADEHRGETVLVVGRQATLGVLAAVAGPDDGAAALPPGASVEVHIDADGWTVAGG